MTTRTYTLYLVDAIYTILARYCGSLHTFAKVIIDDQFDFPSSSVIRALCIYALIVVSTDGTHLIVGDSMSAVLVVQVPERLAHLGFLSTCRLTA